jgi:hypothetical protein
MGNILYNCPFSSPLSAKLRTVAKGRYYGMFGRQMVPMEATAMQTRFLARQITKKLPFTHQINTLSDGSITFKQYTSVEFISNIAIP